MVPARADGEINSRLSSVNGHSWFSKRLFCLAKPDQVPNFFLIPWVVLLFGMGSNNYDRHIRCKLTNSYDSANNFLDLYYTVLSFNEGYHVAHHMNPGLHWSLLPRYHEVVETNRFDNSLEALPQATQTSRGVFPVPEYQGPSRINKGCQAHTKPSIVVRCLAELSINLIGKPHALLKLLEAKLVAQAVKNRIDVYIGQPDKSLLIAFLEPFERFRLVTEAKIN